MKEKKMTYTNPENNSVNNAGNEGPAGTNWREQRCEWRRQRREIRRRDPMRGLFLGLLLILAGGLFLAVQMGGMNGDNVWKYFMAGLGVIFIIDGLVRYHHPEFPYFVYGKFVAGSILLLTGILFIFDFNTFWWPIILVAAGCAFLVRLVLRRA
jgi:hypothetical protein